jgi:hypothetical protein
LKIIIQRDWIRLKRWKILCKHVRM